MESVPKVHVLAEQLASGRSPVEVYETNLAAMLVLVPAGGPAELKPLKLELRARIQFAWELARKSSIKNGARKPVKNVPPTLPPAGGAA